MVILQPACDLGRAANLAPDLILVERRGGRRLRGQRSKVCRMDVVHQLSRVNLSRRGPHSYHGVLALADSRDFLIRLKRYPEGMARSFYYNSVGGLA